VIVIAAAWPWAAITTLQPAPARSSEARDENDIGVGNQQPLATPRNLRMHTVRCVVVECMNARGIGIRLPTTDGVVGPRPVTPVWHRQMNC
jgi:hypothetical protein